MSVATTIIFTLLSLSTFSYPPASASSAPGPGSRRRHAHHDARHRLRQSLVVHSNPPGWDYVGCVSESIVTGTFEKVFNSSSLTPQNCAAVCNAKGLSAAGLSNGTDCWCRKTLEELQPLEDGACSTSCSGSFGQNCGGIETFSIYAKGVIATRSTLPQWSSQGCYVDSTATGILSLASYQEANMTQESCQAFCTPYTYAGVENGTSCHCGNSISASTTGAACSVPCGGNADQMCGGILGNLLVFVQGIVDGVLGQPTTTATSTSMTATKTSTTASVSASSWYNPGSPSSWSLYKPVGCFQDSSSAHVLTEPAPSFLAGPGLVLSTCAAWCLAEGKAYAGLEGGSQCYCGDHIQLSSTSVLVDPAECEVPCTGDWSKSSACGGNSTMEVYYNGLLDFGACPNGFPRLG